MTTKPRITANVEYGNNAPPIDDRYVMDPWTVRLKYGRRQLTVPFFTGTAWRDREITAADVLCSLVSEASSYDNARSFGDFCSDFGYDIDSRKAHRVYEACGRISRKLQQFLGDDYDLVMGFDEDELRAWVAGAPVDDAGRVS